jgi:hypothetical protein
VEEEPSNVVHVSGTKTLEEIEREALMGRPAPVLPSFASQLPKTSKPSAPLSLEELEQVFSSEMTNNSQLAIKMLKFSEC